MYNDYDYDTGVKETKMGRIFATSYLSVWFEVPGTTFTMGASGAHFPKSKASAVDRIADRLT